jgi:hypothetical protein
MGRIGNLLLIFTSPSVAARNIDENPHWLIPLIIVLAVTFLVGFASHKQALDFRRTWAEPLYERSGKTKEEIDEEFTSTPTKGLTAGAAGAASIGVVLLVAAAIYKGLASVFGGKIEFRKMFALQVHAALILSLGELVKLPIVRAKDSIDVRTGIGAFAPSISLNSPLGTFLAQLDLFGIWSLVALAIGFSVLAGLGMKKSAAIVFGLWAVFVGILVGLAVLGSRFMGGA